MLARADRSPLSAVALHSLYQAMPTWDEAENDPEGAEARRGKWEAENPSLLENFLVLRMLRFTRARVLAIQEYCSRSDDCE